MLFNCRTTAGPLLTTPRSSSTATGGNQSSAQSENDGRGKNNNKKKTVECKRALPIMHQGLECVGACCFQNAPSDSSRGFWVAEGSKAQRNSVQAATAAQKRREAGLTLAATDNRELWLQTRSNKTKKCKQLRRQRAKAHRRLCSLSSELRFSGCFIYEFLVSSQRMKDGGPLIPERSLNKFILKKRRRFDLTARFRFNCF